MKTLPVLKWMSVIGLSLVTFYYAHSQYYEFRPVENFGGKAQLTDFLAQEMIYPEKARQEKIEGTVIIQFEVDKEGVVSDVAVKQSVREDLDKEAMRLFRYLLWEPAQLRGAPIESQTTVEIPFSIKKYQRHHKKPDNRQMNLSEIPVDTSFRIYKSTQLKNPPKPVYSQTGMKFGDFVQQNMVYPATALKQSFSGMVEIFFVVETSGRISNIKLLKSVSGGCNEEAIRLLKLLKWKPGIYNDMAVRTEMVLQISFNLTDYQQMRYVPPSNNSQF